MHGGKLVLSEQEAAMKIFIDTADVDEIREALALGMLDGVTTNPSLVAKSGKPFRQVVAEICELVKGPVSAEVIATDHATMLSQARDLAQIAQNIVVKIPLTPDGLKTAKSCSDEGIATNVTLCFSPTQALLAAKAGATYVSPFVGRLDDISFTGMELIEQILEIYRNYDFETEVLVASVRNPLHVFEAATMGAHVATIPFNVIGQLAKHPLTDIGLARFLEDWNKAGLSLD
jgi:transaldolase